MIVAPIPVLGRRAILPWTLKRLIDIGIKPLCIVETNKDKALLNRYGIDYLAVPAIPLGEKWNRGFEWAKTFDPEAVIYLGSDDWVSSNILDVFLPYLDEYDMIGLKGAYFINRSYRVKPFAKSLGAYDQNLTYWNGYTGDREGESVGGGRILSNRILTLMGWKPFRDENVHNMDYNMLYKVMTNGGRIKTYQEDDVKVLAWSTDLWGTKHEPDLLSAHEIEDIENFLTKHFPEGLELWSVDGVYSHLRLQ